MSKVSLNIANLFKNPSGKLSIADDTQIPNPKSDKILANISQALDQPRVSQGLHLSENNVNQFLASRTNNLPHTLVIHGETALERVLQIMSQLRASINEPESQNSINEIKPLFDKLAEYHQASADHSARVAEESFHIGLDLGLSTKKLFKLINSAFLHDLGKIGVPVETLNFPNEFSDVQWAQIKTHPEIGYKILKEEKQIPNELVGWHGVLWHHVWVDGHGYPNLAKGEKLSFIPRIIEVADVFDALTDPNRVYKKSVTTKEALKIIVEGINTQFDEVPVESLVRIKGYTIKELRDEINQEKLQAGLLKISA